MHVGVTEGEGGAEQGRGCFGRGHLQGGGEEADIAGRDDKQLRGRLLAAGHDGEKAELRQRAKVAVVLLPQAFELFEPRFDRPRRLERLGHRGVLHPQRVALDRPTDIRQHVGGVGDDGAVGVERHAAGRALARADALAHLPPLARVARVAREAFPVAAEVEQFLDLPHDLVGRVLVGQRTEVVAGPLVDLVLAGEARVGRRRVHVDEPRRVEAQHAAVALGEAGAGGLEVDPILLEGTVDARVVDAADDRRQVGAAGWPVLLRRRAEAVGEAGAQVLDAQQLHRPAGRVGEEVDAPLCRNFGKKRVYSGGGIEVRDVFEQCFRPSHSPLTVGPGWRGKRSANTTSRPVSLLS